MKVFTNMGQQLSYSCSKTNLAIDINDRPSHGSAYTC